MLKNELVIISQRRCDSHPTSQSTLATQNVQSLLTEAQPSISGQKLQRNYLLPPTKVWQCHKPETWRLAQPLWYCHTYIRHYFWPAEPFCNFPHIKPAVWKTQGTLETKYFYKFRTLETMARSQFIFIRQDCPKFQSSRLEGTGWSVKNPCLVFRTQCHVFPGADISDELRDGPRYTMTISTWSVVGVTLNCTFQFSFIRNEPSACSAQPHHDVNQSTASGDS